MSTTEEQAECPHEAWEECGGGSRKGADCGAFLPRASTDTPTPERVTLSDEERDRRVWQAFVNVVAAREKEIREEAWRLDLTLTNLSRTLDDAAKRGETSLPVAYLREALGNLGVIACDRGICSANYGHEGRCDA